MNTPYLFSRIIACAVTFLFCFAIILFCTACNKNSDNSHKEYVIDKIYVDGVEKTTYQYNDQWLRTQSRTYNRIDRKSGYYTTVNYYYNAIGKVKRTTTDNEGYYYLKNYIYKFSFMGRF